MDENSNWEKLNGGYKIPYNAFKPLNDLRQTTDPKITSGIFADLWENLHHQGDVGEASYYSIPQLIDICILKKSLDWNYVGLCVVIENCRLSNNNPQLPKELEQEYFHSLKKLEQYLLSNIQNMQNNLTLHMTLSLVATINGHRQLGKVLELLDDEDSD